MPALLAVLLLLASTPRADAHSDGDLVVRSGAEYAYPPFCYVDAEGNARGFSIELLEAATAAMGHQVTFRTGPWERVRGWLESGEIDALPVVGRTPEREHVFDFTPPYLSMHGAIVVRAWRGTEG